MQKVSQVHCYRVDLRHAGVLICITSRSQVLGINDTSFNHPQLRVLPLIGDNASIFAETTLNAGSSSAIRNRATWDGVSSSVRMRLLGLLGGANSENRQQTQIVFSFELACTTMDAM